MDSFKRPETNNKLIVEGAEGLMVPLILLTINILKQYQIAIKGIIFNRAVNEGSIPALD